MNLSNVLVGCPTYDGMEYCRESYVKHVKHLTYKKYDVVLVDNSKKDIYQKKLEKGGIKVLKDTWQEEPLERVVSSRNILRQYAVDKEYDYLLMLEQDVIPPQTIIERLMRHQKPAVTGIYYKPFTLNIVFDNKVIKRKEIRPLLYLFVPQQKDKFHFCTKKDVEGNYLIRAAASGLGCMLIHRDIFTKIPFRTDGKLFDDNFFCEDLRNNNIPLYADTSAKCKHLVLQKPAFQVKKQKQ